MRTQLLSLLLGLALFVAPAFAQGAGGSSQGAAGKALKQALGMNMTSGPGNIQQSFFNNLKGCLGKSLGKNQGNKAYQKFQRQNLSTSQVQNMMNGTASKSQLKKWFGASRKQVGKIKKSLDRAVDQKNKDGFFGMLITVMVGDYGMDPTADFTKQAGGAKETVSKEQFSKLLNSNVSTKSIGDIFGFKSKDDSKFMQKILNSVQSSPFAKHPMMQSMGMGGSRKYSKGDFPKLQKGMPGGDMAKDATPGGMRFDSSLPPCPFFSGSFKDVLTKSGAGDSGATKPQSGQQGGESKGKK